MPLVKRFSPAEINATKHQVCNLETRLRMPILQRNLDEEFFLRCGVTSRWFPETNPNYEEWEGFETTFHGEHPAVIVKSILAKSVGAERAQHLEMMYMIQQMKFDQESQFIHILWRWNDSHYSQEQKNVLRYEHMQNLRSRLVPDWYKHMFINYAKSKGFDVIWLDVDNGTTWHDFVNPRCKFNGFQHPTVIFVDPATLIEEEIMQVPHTPNCRLFLWLYTSPVLQNDRDQVIFYQFLQ